MIILLYPLLVELHRTFIRKVLPRQKSSLGQSSREKRQSRVGVLEWRGSSSPPSDLRSSRPGPCWGCWSGRGSTSTPSGMRSTSSWGLAGGAEVERISIYTLSSEEQSSWALLLKFLIINCGDKMKAWLISLARRKYSLNICWLLNRLWLIFLSPNMRRETSL